MKLQIQFQPTGARIAGGDKEDVDLAVKAAVMLLKAARGPGCTEWYALNYIFL